MSLKSLCAYCGQPANKRDKEHVIPKCLYAPSLANTRVQRLTIPACRTCNNSWADDEVHFRNVLVVAGDPPSPQRHELWETTMQRSFQQGDGLKRMLDLVTRFRVTNIPGEERYIINPGDDPRVQRVVRKIIRGLAYHHGLNWPVSDSDVVADVPRQEFPYEILNEMEHHHRDQRVIEYWFRSINHPDARSFWVLRFFQHVLFIGVTKNEQHETQVPDAA